MSKKRKCETKDIADPYEFNIRLTNQIVVETNPITRLQTAIVHNSDPLLAFAESFKDSSDRNKYENCIIILNDDDISIETWQLIALLFREVDLTTSVFSSDTLDDMLYILHKYDIRLSELMLDNFREFMKKCISSGNTIFKRMTCLESNPKYYSLVIDIINDICDEHRECNKRNIIKNLPKKMMESLLIKVIIDK